MKRLTGPIGIAQGSRLLFSDFADGGPMWTAQGHRESRTPITFPDAFRSPPAVIVGISLMDLDHTTNTRTEILADQVTTAGFDIVFRTWGDTRVARVRAEWTAIGTLRDDDQWEVD
ncbi:MAG: H-type lectin domain-containing protein [Gemmobacter sp.]